MVDVFHLILFAGGVRLTRFGIRRSGFARTVRTLGKLGAIGRKSTPHPIPVSTLAGAVRAVSGSPYHASCLDRSVFLWFLMQRRGLDGSLRIGVTYRADVLEGHAWVELDGFVVNDASDIADRYAVFGDDPTGIVFK